MARHHVISTTACDVFFKLVAHQRKSLGARFDSMIVTFSADGQPVLGATLRNAKSGCELHRLAGQPDECWCCGYDEQLEFVSPANMPLAHADYRLTLSDGETWTGTTDARGRTGRVASKREEEITTVEFFPQEDSRPCCSASPNPVAPTAIIFELQDVKTTDRDIDISVKQVKVDSMARPLTRGEIDMAWMIFEDAVDYSKVKIHKRPYLWLFQPKSTAMTPNGEMYFHESRFLDDFSSADNTERHWFIHGMVHVWQYQLKYPVAMRGAFRIGLDYKYVLSSKRKLEHFMKRYSLIFSPTEKVKKIYLAAISSALLSSIYLDAGATSRIADAEISSVNGTPCFTISQTEEKRNGQPLLGALSISDLSVKPATKVWSFVMSGGRKVPLSSKICLLYGDIPQGANGMPAPELQTGRVYSIFLNGRPDDPSDPTYGYRGKFCIVATSAGERKIIAIDSVTEAWRRDSCPEHSLIR